MRDWYLFVGVSIIVGIILAFISLGTAIPQTRPFPTPVTDEERPTGQTVSYLVVGRPGNEAKFNVDETVLINEASYMFVDTQSVLTLAIEGVLI